MIHITISDILKKELEKEAESKGLSLSAYVRMILTERNK